MQYRKSELVEKLLSSYMHASNSLCSTEVYGRWFALRTRNSCRRACVERGIHWPMRLTAEAIDHAFVSTILQTFDDCEDDDDNDDDDDRATPVRRRRRRRNNSRPGSVRLFLAPISQCSVAGRSATSRWAGCAPVSASTIGASLPPPSSLVDIQTSSSPLIVTARAHGP